MPYFWTFKKRDKRFGFLKNGVNDNCCVKKGKQLKNGKLQLTPACDLIEI